MLKKLHLTFSVTIIFLISSSILKAELQVPNNLIMPNEVIKIQLVGLMNNDKNFKDSGIEQTWNFAHPENKKYTGPLPHSRRLATEKSPRATNSRCFTALVRTPIVISCLQYFTFRFPPRLLFAINFLSLETLSGNAAWKWNVCIHCRQHF